MSDHIKASQPTSSRHNDSSAPQSDHPNLPKSTNVHGDTSVPFSKSGSNYPLGIVSLEIHNGASLPYSNSYLMVSCNDVVHKVQPTRKSRNPEYSTHLYLPVMDPYDHIRVELYTKRSLGTDEVVGVIIVPVRALIDRFYHTANIPFLNQEDARLSALLIEKAWLLWFHSLSLEDIFTRAYSIILDASNPSTSFTPLITPAMQKPLSYCFDMGPNPDPVLANIVKSSIPSLQRFINDPSSVYVLSSNDLNSSHSNGFSQNMTVIIASLALPQSPFHSLQYIRSPDPRNVISLYTPLLTSKNLISEFSGSNDQFSKALSFNDRVYSFIKLASFVLWRKISPHLDSVLMALDPAPVRIPMQYASFGPTSYRIALFQTQDQTPTSTSKLEPKPINPSEKYSHLSRKSSSSISPNTPYDSPNSLNITNLSSSFQNNKTNKNISSLGFSPTKNLDISVSMVDNQHKESSGFSPSNRFPSNPSKSSSPVHIIPTKNTKSSSKFSPSSKSLKLDPSGFSDNMIYPPEPVQEKKHFDFGALSISIQFSYNSGEMMFGHFRKTHDSKTFSSRRKMNPDPLDFGTLKVNGKRFVKSFSSISHLFKSITNVLLWKNPAITLFWFLMYMIIAYHNLILPIIPALSGIAMLLNNLARKRRLSPLLCHLFGFTFYLTPSLDEKIGSLDIDNLSDMAKFDDLPSSSKSEKDSSPPNSSGDGDESQDSSDDGPNLAWETLFGLHSNPEQNSLISKGWWWYLWFYQVPLDKIQLNEGYLSNQLSKVSKSHSFDDKFYSVAENATQFVRKIFYDRKIWLITMFSTFLILTAPSIFIHFTIIQCIYIFFFSLLFVFLFIPPLYIVSGQVFNIIYGLQKEFDPNLILYGMWLIFASTVRYYKFSISPFRLSSLFQK